MDVNTIRLATRLETPASLHSGTNSAADRIPLSCLSPKADPFQRQTVLCDNGDTDGVLTEEATQHPETGWKGRLDPALARHLDAVSLDQARLRMLFYLDWVSADLAFRAPPKDVAHAIKLGADRLREIARAMPRRSQRGVRTPTGTQKEIARAAGVSRTTVSRIERGRPSRAA